MSSLSDIASARDALTEDLRRLGVREEVGLVNWTYGAAGERIEAAERAEAIVMGLNPGAGGGGSEARWRTRCKALTEGLSANFMLAELVLVDTHDVGVLKAKYDVGNLIDRCAALNKAIIGFHQPRFIFQTGFDFLDRIVKAYDLELLGFEPRPQHPTHTLLKHYRMRDSDTAWISIKHPSSMGFSNADIEAIRRYAFGRSRLPMPGLIPEVTRTASGVSLAET